MYVSVKDNDLLVQFSNEERKILLGYYSDSLTSIAIAIQRHLNEWSQARVKLKEEQDMRYLADRFGRLSTDRQNEVMEILRGTNG